MRGKVCSVSMEHCGALIFKKILNLMSLLWGRDPLTPFPDLYPVCWHWVAFVCMFSPATTTHLLTWTLSDPSRTCPCCFLFQPNNLFPSALFGVVGCKTKGTCRDAYASWWMHSNTVYRRPVPPDSLSSFVNVCCPQHLQEPPPQPTVSTLPTLEETDNWPQSNIPGFLTLKQSKNGRQNIDH